GPATVAEITSGSAAAADATPVSAALPVVCRTNHGTASIVNTLPVMEKPLAASSTISGRLTALILHDDCAVGMGSAPAASQRTRPVPRTRQAWPDRRSRGALQQKLLLDQTPSAAPRSPFRTARFVRAPTLMRPLRR